MDTLVHPGGVSPLEALVTALGTEHGYSLIRNGARAVAVRAFGRMGRLRCLSTLSTGPKCPTNARLLQPAYELVADLLVPSSYFFHITTWWWDGLFIGHAVGLR